MGDSLGRRPEQGLTHGKCAVKGLLRDFVSCPEFVYYLSFIGSNYLLEIHFLSSMGPQV